jgi:hypothetical protein
VADAKKKSFEGKFLYLRFLKKGGKKNTQSLWGSMKKKKSLETKKFKINFLLGFFKKRPLTHP